MSYIPSEAMQNEVIADLRDILDAPDRGEADRRLQRAVEKYAESTPKLADWMRSKFEQALQLLDDQERCGRPPSLGRP